jgi:large subunit ribosomal protein L10
MNANRQAKEQVVSEVNTKLGAAKATVLFEYRGLTVTELEALRNDLRAEGVELKVYKNRLVKLAAEQAGYNGLADSLTGPNAIAFSNEDEVAAARIISDHAKKNDVIKFKAGVFEGNVVGTDTLTELANLPSRETLLTQIAAGLLQPLTEVARGLGMLDETHLTAAGNADVKEAAEEAIEAVEEAADAVIEEIVEEAKEEIEAAETVEEVKEIKADAEAAIEAVEEAAEEVIEEIAEEANEETK